MIYRLAHSIIARGLFFNLREMPRMLFSIPGDLHTRLQHRAAHRLFAALIMVPAMCAAQEHKSDEWLTWGADAARTGWNKAETTLSKKTVGGLELKWKA